MRIVTRLLNQAKTPTGRVGRLITRLMNAEHSKLTDWALQHVPIEDNYSVLDVGCGGGRTVAKLARVAAHGRVYGIDVSEASIAVARKTNERSIETGNVEVLRASVSNLPFADGSFDLATAVETYYFWPELISDMKEILRVLKPGGLLAIVAATYKGSIQSRQHERFFTVATQEVGMWHLDEAQFRTAFATAGFKTADVHIESKRGWICIIGKKAT